MDCRFICSRPSSKPSLPRPLSLFGLSSPAAASASSPFALHLPPRLLLASSAATPSSSASSSTTVAAQNPNPFNLNINLLPWLHELRFPHNFLCQPQRGHRLLRPVLRLRRRRLWFRGRGDFRGASPSCGSSSRPTRRGSDKGAGRRQLFSRPVLGLITKHFSVLYDIEERNTLLSSGAIRLRASHDAKVSCPFSLSGIKMPFRK
nr:unnamed protein product [Digitaria exilis]